TKSKKESVIVLQKFLKKINLYNGGITGIYNTEVINSIYNFQKNNNIVSNWSDINAGYWSVQTRNLVWKKYSAGEFIKKDTEVVAIKGKIEQPKIVLESVQEKAKIEPQVETVELIDIFSKAISNKEGVERLQRILTKLGFYNGEISGEYSDVRSSVLDFQIDHKVINHKASIGAGNYGPATRKALDKAYKQYGITKEKEKKADEKTNQTIEAILLEIDEDQETINNVDQVKLSREATTRVYNLGNIKRGDVSHEVRDLQKILNELGFFEQKDTAIFGSKTQDALINYQLQKGIISDKSIYGAGLVGPKTKAQLIKDLSA
ncbi:peptidoglycan-binding protein, partial [Candidatus Gracilibacteria bacterium]|nr:peptidoglycan-binding protein [Candidatus Gracilibacteria bacterium]